MEYWRKEISENSLLKGRDICHLSACDSGGDNMKKLFIMLGIVCLFMTSCQTAQKTIPEITTIAPADSAHEETETNKEERAEDASVAVKSLKIGSSKGNPDDLSSLYQTIQTHSDHNHCKSNKHRINHFAPPGFRISNAKHKITDPDNISDKQQAAAIKNSRIFLSRTR